MLRKNSATPFRFLCWLIAAASAVAQGAQEMPKIEGESLAGHQVVLPEAAAGKVAVLVFGFSKASKGPTSAWGKKISADFGSQAGFALYQVPVLEDVPRFIRGVVISGIKKGVPEGMRDHFVPVVQREAELQKLVSYKEPDDAYLVVLDRDGKIAGQLHGALNDASYSQLRGQVESLLNGHQ
jgi:hypothetical protein